MTRALLAVFLVTGCGYQARDAELIGQVKRVTMSTPIICSDYASVDVSLGVMRNGVGSMSSEDVWLYVQNDDQARDLKQAAESGKLVKLTYDQRRLTFCVPDKWLKRIEVIPG